MNTKRQLHEGVEAIDYVEARIKELARQCRLAATTLEEDCFMSAEAIIGNILSELIHINEQLEEWED